MTIRKTWLAASVSAALFSLAAQAADENAAAPAESSAQTQTLQNVTVSAVNRSTRTENKDTYTTSAMKTTTGLALLPKETPQLVSVITKTQLSDRGISSLKDAMKTTTGVNVLRESGRYRFQSRGFYVDQIEEDGVSTTVAGSSGNPYRDAQSLYDMAIYDHVEVVRGATGLTQVNGEPGGTVNAVRKFMTSRAAAGIRPILGTFSAVAWIWKFQAASPKTGKSLQATRSTTANICAAKTGATAYRLICKAPISAATRPNTFSGCIPAMICLGAAANGQLAAV